MTNPSRLSRRRFLSTGAAAVAALQLHRAARAAGLPTVGVPLDAPACLLTPEQEVGPFYIGDELVRADITEGKPGLPLTLRIAVLDSRSCTPLRNAAIDVWHCDAMGLYAGYTKTSLMGQGGPGGPPDGAQRGPDDHGGGPPAMKPSDKLTFLRGIQLTDADGAVIFQSIFPGFYMGRVNHIHFKVRVDGQAGKTYEAGHTAHIGQVFFPEAMAAELMHHPPYSRHKIQRTTAEEDGIFQSQHGDLSVALVTPLEKGNPKAGFHAELKVSVDPTATPAPVGMGGPGGPGPGGPGGRRGPHAPGDHGH